MGVYPPYVLKTQTWEFQNLHLTGLIFQNLLKTEFALFVNLLWKLLEAWEKKRLKTLPQISNRSGQVAMEHNIHDDTLIVVDAEKLNVEIDSCDGSDGDISEALYRNCKKYFAK